MNLHSITCEEVIQDRHKLKLTFWVENISWISHLAYK